MKRHVNCSQIGISFIGVSLSPQRTDTLPRAFMQIIWAFLFHKTTTRLFLIYYSFFIKIIITNFYLVHDNSLGHRL